MLPAGARSARGYAHLGRAHKLTELDPGSPSTWGSARVARASGRPGWPGGNVAPALSTLTRGCEGTAPAASGPVNLATRVPRRARRTRAWKKSQSRTGRTICSMMTTPRGSRRATISFSLWQRRRRAGLGGLPGLAQPRSRTRLRVAVDFSLGLSVAARSGARATRRRRSSSPAVLAHTDRSTAVLSGNLMVALADQNAGIWRLGWNRPAAARHEAVRRAGRRPAVMTPSQRRATRLVRVGRLSRAARALLAQPPAPQTLVVW